MSARTTAAGSGLRGQVRMRHPTSAFSILCSRAASLTPQVITSGAGYPNCKTFLRRPSMPHGKRASLYLTIRLAPSWTTPQPCDACGLHTKLRKITWHQKESREQQKALLHYPCRLYRPPGVQPDPATAPLLRGVVPCERDRDWPVGRILCGRATHRRTVVGTPV